VGVEVCLVVGAALAVVLTTAGNPDVDAVPDGDGEAPADSLDDAEADGDPSPGSAGAGSAVLCGVLEPADWAGPSCRARPVTSAIIATTKTAAATAYGRYDCGLRRRFEVASGPAGNSVVVSSSPNASGSSSSGTSCGPR
jgi:hypothetical protein